MLIVSRNFERRFATAVIASIVALLSFASVAQAIDRISVIPGFNAPVNAISEPDSNGTRYLGGDFTAFDVWGTGSGALVGASSGDVNPSFPKVNGSIYATAADGLGGFYIGGSFTCIGANTSGLCNGADDVPRNRAAHINANGSVDTSWNPDLNNAVRAIGVLGSNVYLGGDFTTVDSAVGDKTRNRAAAVDATTGVATSWNPNLSNIVLAIAVSGSNVYLGGNFTAVGGTTRNRAAAVRTGSRTAPEEGTCLDNYNTADCLTDWNPDLNSGVLAIAVSGSNVYLGGNFTTVGGTTRNRAAAVRTGSRTAPEEGTCLDNYNTADCLTAWNPDPNGAVRAIGVSGSNVYLGGDFSWVGGTARNYAAAVGTNGTLDPAWNPNPDSDVSAIGVSGSNVYLGGNFTTVGGITRNHAAAVTAAGAGTLSSWNPDLDGGVLAIGVSGSNVYLGGDFTSAGGTTRNNAAAVDAAGILTSWNPDLNSTVYAIALSDSTVYLGGEFESVGGTARNYAAAVGTDGDLDLDWDPDLSDAVYAIAVSDSTVYLGGNFDQVGDTERNHLAAVETDGDLDLDWDPDPDGGVYAIGISESTVYLGGNFTAIVGIARNRAAAVGTDGDLDLDWDPDPSDAVYAIAVSGSTVYLGGNFDQVGDTERNYLAAVGTDGDLDLDWDPNLDNSVLAIGVSGSNVYLGGFFTTVGGIARNRAAAVGTDGTLDPDWDPNLNNSVLAIAVSADTVYLGGYFTTVDGQRRGRSAAVGTDGTLLSPWPGPLVTDVPLSVSKSGGGSGTVASSPAGIDCGATCSTTFASGTSVTLTATPATGSSFTGWSGSGCSGTSTCVVTMSEARDVNAEFTIVPPGQFDLMVSKSGTGAGTVTSSPAGIDCGSDCSESLLDGTSVTLTATPATGSSFTGWSGSGCSGTSTCTVVMSEARAVTAEFVVVPPGQFDLMVSKSGTGGGTVTSSPAGIDCGSDCSETLADGTSVTLTATPAAGSTFTAWSGSGCSGTSTCTVTMSEARAVDAKFTKKPSNVFPTPTVKAGASALSSSVRVPGRGTITQRVTRSSTAAAVLTVCKTSGKATKAGWVKLTCKLSKATRAALRLRSLRVSMKTTFTPTGGLPASKTQAVTLKSQRPPPYTG